MGGLRIDSLSELPPQMRKQVAEKMLMDPPKNKGTPARPAPSEKPANKYHNVKTEIREIQFDSRKEARRYLQLMEAVRLGAITDLRLQVDFTLQEAYTTPEGLRIRAIRYKADFTYRVAAAGYDKLALLGAEDIEYWRSRGSGAYVVEDVKSRPTRTKDYIMKRKMMADHGHIIREV